MLKLERKQFWIVGLCVAILSFILITIGMTAVSTIGISIENYMAYIIFSLLTGIIAAVFIYFRLRIAFLLYIAGLVLGFFLMFYAFLYNTSGWGDLVGVLSLMMWTIIGLGAGLLVQLAYYLYKKFKK
jgi:hypothetical protein